MSSSPATLGATILVIALPLAACSRGASPAPPTAWALELEVQRDSVRLLAAAPSQGRPATNPMRDDLASLRSGNSLWIEYAMKGVSNQSLLDGGFIVTMNGIAEPGVDTRGGLVSIPKRVITVRVPYVAAVASVAFARADPSADEPERWPRSPVGSSVFSVKAYK